MGIYQYTLRAPTKKVSGIEIGQFLYGYKCGWGASETRFAKSLSALAEKAAYKLKQRGVKHFVQGEFHDGQPIYYTSEPFAEFTEELRTTPIVGTLKKVGGRWTAVMKSDEELLVAHPEVGMLQTGNGPRYYVDGFTANQYDSLRDVLYYALLKRVMPARRNG